MSAEQNLESMRPIRTDKEYAELVALTEQFVATVGPRLQRYLWIKSWLSVNYVRARDRATVTRGVL